MSWGTGHSRGATGTRNAMFSSSDCNLCMKSHRSTACLCVTLEGQLHIRKHVLVITALFYSWRCTPAFPPARTRHQLAASLFFLLQQAGKSGVGNWSIGQLLPCRPAVTRGLKLPEVVCVVGCYESSHDSLQTLVY